jgi:hypothetical protein
MTRSSPRSRAAWSTGTWPVSCAHTIRSTGSPPAQTRSSCLESSEGTGSSTGIFPFPPLLFFACKIAFSLVCFREEWFFCRYISSDCDSVDVLYNNQHYTKTPEDAAAISIKAG